MTDAADPLMMHRFLRQVDRVRGGLFAGVVVLYLVAFNGQLRVTDDSAWYVTVGTNLAEGRGYTYHGEGDTVSFPTVPLMVAAGRAVSAEHGMLVTHALLMAMGLLTIAAAYRLFLLHAERGVAVFAAVVFACLHTMHEHAVRLLTDGPFVLGVVVTLWGYGLVMRGRDTKDADHPTLGPPSPAQRSANSRGHGWGWALLAVGLSLAVVSRVMMMALVLALVIVCGWRVLRGPGRARHLGIALLTVAVVGAFYLLDPRKTEVGYTQTRTYEAGLVRYATDLGPVLHQSLTRFVPMLFTEAGVNGVFAVEFDPFTSTALSLAALGLGVIGVWGRPLWAWFFVINLAVMLVFTPNGRYFLPLLPLIAFGAVRLVVWLGTRRHPVPRHALPGLCMVLLLLPNMIKNIDLIIEQRRSPTLEHYKDGRYVGVRALGQTIAAELPADVLVLADHAAPLTMYSGDRLIFGGLEVRKRRTLEDVRAYLATYPSVYVVQPMTADLAELVDELQITLVESGLSVPRLDAEQPWTVWRVERAGGLTSAAAGAAGGDAQ